ncbi:M56 family metallopeptidase [Butyricicoccus pullicaecorum]|nr:M56 family metallopeptidase [Butyricicoccus pullicaecorum]
MNRLFWNVLQVSLTTSVVLLPLLLMRTALRKRYPAGIRVLLWACIVLRLLVPVQLPLPAVWVVEQPALTVSTPAQTGQASVPPAVQTADTTGDNVGMNRPTAVSVAAEQAAFGWNTALCLLWLAGAVVLLAVLLGSYAAFRRRLRRTAWPVDDPALRAAFDEARCALDVTHRVTLVTSSAADGPLLCGLIRPVLVLPEAEIDPADAPFIFRHELTHWKRRDLWLKLALVCVRAVHWFNPLVWRMVRTAGEDIELACDQTVVRGLDNAGRRAYGACILNNAAAQRRVRQGLTTCFTDEAAGLKLRLTGLFAQENRKRGRVFLLVCVLLTLLAGGCVAVGDRAEASEVQEAELRQAAEAYAQAVQERDGKAIYDMLRAQDQPDYYRARQEDGQRIAGAETIVEGQGEPNWTIGVSSPWVTAYAVYPDAERMGAYIVLNWSATNSPDIRSCVWQSFVREDGALRLVEPDDVFGGGTAHDLETFERLYGVLGLPKTGGSMRFTDPDSWVGEVLGWAGGQQMQVDADSIEYEFANGQRVKVSLKHTDDGWVFDSWEAVQDEPYRPDDETALHEMTELTALWSDALLHGFRADDAERLGYPLHERFEECLQSYGTDEAGRCPVANLPSGVSADHVTDTLDGAQNTALFEIHAQTPLGGMTQTERVTFGWEQEQAKIIDRETVEVMRLDDPDGLITRADELTTHGLPDEMRPGGSPQAAVYLNFRLYGGQYRTEPEQSRVIYTFADGSRAAFGYAETEDGQYRVTGLRQAAHDERVADAREVAVYQAANQWAEGYLRKNAVFRMPAIGRALRADFVRQQERTYGMRWFWRIGWGSSPSVAGWTVSEVTPDSALVTYDLTAGGEHWRYAERLTLGEEDGRTVVTACRTAEELHAEN